MLDAFGRLSSDVIVITDRAGRVTYANPVALETFNLSLDESLGTDIFEYLHPDDSQRVAQRFSELVLTPGMSIRDEVRALTPDGRTRDFEIVTTNCLADASIEGIIVNGRDVSERRQYVERLQTREHWYRTLAANSRVATTVLDDRGQTLWVGPANERFSGYPDGDRLGHSVFDLVHPDDVARATRLLTQVIENGGTSDPVVLRLVLATGEWRFIEVVATNSLHDAAVGGIIINSTDVTERTHLTRALQTLTQGNQILVRATDESSLLSDVCEAIVDSGHYLLAWVGMGEDDDARSVRPVAAAGRRDYLDEPGLDSGSGVLGIGPSGTAIRTGEVQVVADFRAADARAPWTEAAEHHGLRTACAIPLTVEGMTIGALCIYAGEPGAFGPAEVGLLSELADELSYGVHRIRDAERLERQEERLRRSEQRFRIAFEQNMAPMLFVDLEDRITAANRAFCTMLGYTNDELVGHDSTMFTHPDDVGITEESFRHLAHGGVDQERYMKRYIRKDGQVIFVEVSRSLARDADGRALYYVISERDVTQERALTARIDHQVLHDPLTGLANRVLFEDRLFQAHARTVRGGGLGAVLILNVDDFKGVNDVYGLVAGDQLLIAIARRLESATRPSDTLSRLGGDGFLYLAEGLASSDEAEGLARRLMSVVAEPYQINDAAVTVRASVGIVVWDRAGRSPHEFIRDADVAVEVAKAEGKGRHAIFTPAMHERAKNRYVVVQELHLALQRNELSMHYQPIVDLASQEVVGFEALMRWGHPERGWVPPSDFIPVAEQGGLITDLDSFALREATAAASSWRTIPTEKSQPYVTVNVSASQFHDPNLVASIEEVLAASDLSPERLIIEITEGVLLRNASDATTVVRRLGELGVGVALDDFGTGYSSLSYLATLHPKVIKIDRSFVAPAHDSARNDALLETIIALGQKLDITILAEGIETALQFKRLRRLGCQMGQGYFFSRAVPCDAVGALVARREWEAAETVPRADA